VKIKMKFHDKEEFVDEDAVISKASKKLGFVDYGGR
jgi:hypothetical protein